MREGRWLWLVAGLWLAASSTATAQATAEYKQLVNDALREYERGHFSEAKAFFAQAHALWPNARSLRGLGMSSYELRSYVEAIDHFEAALRSTERPLTPEMKAEVTQLLSHARAFITRVELHLTPANAEVRVDTHPARRDDKGLLLLDPGIHELVVEADQYMPATRSIRADGNETLSFNITLRPLRPEPAPAPTPAEVAQAEEAPAPPPAAVTEPAPSAPSPIGPWIVIGASSAVTIAGGILLAVALSDKAAAENPEPKGGEGPYYVDYYRAERRVFPLSVAGITGLSLGIAGLTTGVIWKVNSGAPQLEATANGVRLRGTF